MGYTRYDPGTWGGYSRSTATKTHRDYDRTTLLPEFDPTKFGMRESVASALNPKPTPVIVGLDVTGSMGRVVEAMRKGLGPLFEELIKRAPVSDPHVMAMAIGDMDAGDRAPVQVTQFEADPVTIGKQIEQLWLERGGGGNDYESYLGPVYFAGMRVTSDAIKEGRKGFLFTVGDEEPQKVLTAANIKRFYGDDVQRDLTAQDLITMVNRSWEYRHLIVEEGSHASAYPDRVKAAWTDLIGQNALPLSDHTKMAEVIISAIEVAVGRDKDTIAKSWSGSTSLVVKHALDGMTTKGGRRSLKGPRAV
jgi:hypothetical protein